MTIRIASVLVGALIAAVMAVVPTGLNAQPGQANAQTTPIGQVSVEGGPPSPIYSFSFGAENLIADAPGGGGATGRPVVHEISIGKSADALTTSLLRYVLEGRHLNGVRIDLFASVSNRSTATFELSDVVVTSLTTNGAAQESVTLRYGQVALTVGGSSFCWNSTNTASC